MGSNFHQDQNMSTKIIRGTIRKCGLKKAWDHDGNEYQQGWITVERTEYTGKLPKELRLYDGMEVVLALKEGSESEIAAGYCVKTEDHWGENWKALKGQTDPMDAYDFMEGTVTEKRKSTDGYFDQTRSIVNQSRVSFTILMGEQQFHASEAEGEWLKIGMDIALVRKQNEVTLIMDKKTGQFSQLTKPYFILFLALIVALVAVKMYLVSMGSEVLPMYAVIVLGIFFLLFGLLNLFSYNAFLQHKRFLMKNLGR
jgi:hypothetical protein